MSFWTWMMIALGGAATQAEAWKREDGRPIVLITWDGLALAEDAAEAHAAACIEAVRAEAKAKEAR